MAANVLNAIAALARYRDNNLGTYAKNYAIRINAVGEKFEYYAKDLLTGSFYSGEDERVLAYSREFSYLGNQNNAIDAIAKGGDAFEIKKVEARPNGLTSGKIALNNSPPKDVLHRDDPRLRSDVKEIDGGNWGQKDMFYAVGSTLGQKVKHIYFVQGTCYAARREVYAGMFNSVRGMVQGSVGASGVEFEGTKELGRIRRVDPLGITDFRLRGMWEIKHPAEVFHRIAPISEESEFTCYAIMEAQKFNEELGKRGATAESFFGGEALGMASHGLVKINDPNNPANLKDAVLIKVEWK